MMNNGRHGDDSQQVKSCADADHCSSNVISVDVLNPSAGEHIF